MKSKEEILKRNVEAIAKCKVKYNLTHQGILNAMEEYARQCQEDNADKKYTEEDMLKCWNACLDFNKPAGLDNAINYRDFINSINDGQD